MCGRRASRLERPNAGTSRTAKTWPLPASIVSPCPRSASPAGGALSAGAAINRGPARVVPARDGTATAGTCLWGAAPGIWVASWPRSRRTPEWGRPGPQLPGLVPSQPGGCRRSPVPAHSARQRWHSCTGCWCVSPRGRSGGAARGCGSPALSSMTWPSRPPPTCWSSSDATARRAAGRIRNFTSRARHSWVARP